MENTILHQLQATELPPWISEAFEHGHIEETGEEVARRDPTTHLKIFWQEIRIEHGVTFL